MKLRTIDDFDFWGKKVLVRADLNSPVVKGKVLMNDRISESGKTIKELTKKGASVVVLAHQSQPGKKDFISLRQHAKLLKVNFVEDTIGKKALKAIEDLKNGRAILLENVRFLKEEFKPSVKNKMVVKLAPLFDYYVNDAFSVSHREQTSIVIFPKVLKSCIGRLMQGELESLERIKMKNCLFVLGGVKMDEVVKLADNRRRILAGGMLGPLILSANGQRFGETEKYLDKKYFKKLRNPRNVIPAIDFAVNADGKRKELALDEFPSKHRVLDIGTKSINIFTKEIKKARCIFVKGPQGEYEDRKFAKGTREILRAAASSKAFSVLGGGHTSSALEQFGLSKRNFDYVSLSGGALVKYIGGEKLAGVEAIRKGKR